MMHMNKMWQAEMQILRHNLQEKHLGNQYYAGVEIGDVGEAAEVAEDADEVANATEEIIKSESNDDGNDDTEGAEEANPEEILNNIDEKYSDDAMNYTYE